MVGVRAASHRNTPLRCDRLGRTTGSHHLLPVVDRPERRRPGHTRRIPTSEPEARQAFRHEITTFFDNVHAMRCLRYPMLTISRNSTSPLEKSETAVHMDGVLPSFFPFLFVFRCLIDGRLSKRASVSKITSRFILAGSGLLREPRSQALRRHALQKTRLWDLRPHGHYGWK